MSSSSELSKSQLVANGLESLDSEVLEIMTCLEEVMNSTGQSHLAEKLPWLNSSKSASVNDSPERTSEVYSIAFQLLDMIEEQVSLMTRKEREMLLGAETEKGLWPRVLKSLREEGFSETAIAEAMQHVRVEPVFTAHPTEAKRPSVRERHRDLYDQLLRLEEPGQTPREKKVAREDMLTAMEALWSTGEIHTERPTIQRELRNALYYLREVFPETLETIDRNLEQAWKEVGFDPATLENAGGGPKIRFGLWIGGDRDGHPFVTAEVTRDTLAELRRQAMKLYRRELAPSPSSFPFPPPRIRLLQHSRNGLTNSSPPSGPKEPTSVTGIPTSPGAPSATSSAPNSEPTSTSHRKALLPTLSSFTHRSSQLARLDLRDVLSGLCNGNSKPSGFILPNSTSVKTAPSTIKPPPNSSKPPGSKTAAPLPTGAKPIGLPSSPPSWSRHGPFFTSTNPPVPKPMPFANATASSSITVARADPAPDRSS